jgi:hypothetical protein
MLHKMTRSSMRLIWECAHGLNNQYTPNHGKGINYDKRKNDSRFAVLVMTWRSNV